MAHSPNWVKERAKCEGEALTVEVFQLAGEATEHLNALKGVSRYKVETDETACRISRLELGHSTRTCVFVYEPEPDHIRVKIAFRNEVSSEENYTISTRWDAEKSKCRIVVTLASGGKVEFPHKHLWKVVQYILEPFFFLRPPRT